MLHRNSHRLAALTASVLAVAAANFAGAETLLLQTDFESDPGALGFFTNAPNAQNAWTTDDAHSGTHSIRSQTSLWSAPVFPANPFEFYKLTFYSKTSGTGGSYGPLTDISRPYAPGTDWAFNQMIWRAEATNPVSNNVEPVFINPAGAPVYIDDVTVSRITPLEAAATLDSMYAQMHQFNFTASPDRHQYIPSSIQKLQNGQTLNVVMLGDSIVNDTSHSYFEPLVDRMYPGADVRVTTSVRGSTGAWYYQDPVQLQSYVFDYNPDLVMIGGISHQNDIDALRSVIQQIKAHNPATEIILMSEAAGGGMDPAALPSLTAPLDPLGTSWRSQLYRLAGDEHVEFLDMTQWYQYILDSGQNYMDFHRDPIHMNGYGEMVAGKILEAYFAPVPEPASLALLTGAACLVGLRPRRRA